MRQVTIREAIDGWQPEDLRNLWSILGGENEDADLANIEKKFKWLYYSQVRDAARATIKNAAAKTMAHITNATPRVVSREEVHECPRYDELVEQATRQLGAHEPSATLAECELYLCHAVIAQAISNMSPKQRAAFFSEAVAAKDLADKAGIQSASLRGPVITFALLGLAQASGFGVYAAATTALGLITHAVGIALPFAAYTGVTATIAYVIGPAGWLAAGFWASLKLTQPDWKRLVPALVYVVSCNARRSSQISTSG